MRRAAVLMILAGLAFTSMVALVKSARAHMSPLELVMWRGVVAAPLALALARGRPLRLNDPRMFAWRTGLGFSAMLCFYTAAKHVGVADLGVLAKLQPLMVAIVAPIVLGASERPGSAIWAMLGLGFAGSAILLAPELSVGSAWGLLVVGGALFSAFARTCLRGLMRTDHPAVVVLWFQCGMSGLGALGLLATGELPAPPPTELWLHIAGIGVTATIGQILMTWAHRAARAAVAAAASYSTVVWAVLADIVVFGVFPGWNVLAGGALIVCAGLWLVSRRE